MELTRYLVELERPAEGWAGLEEAAASARAAAARMRADGVPVRFLRAVFVPEDDACFFLLEGPSVTAVLEATERSQGAAARVTEAARLDGERDRRGA